jgi:AraC family transcriptional regulator
MPGQPVVKLAATQAGKKHSFRTFYEDLIRSILRASSCFAATKEKSVQPKEIAALKSLEPQPSWLALAHVVGASSINRGWQGISCWQQVNPTLHEVVLPPMPTHHIPVQCDGLTRIRQRREGRLHEAIWRTNDMAVVPCGDPSAWTIETRSDIIHIDLDKALIDKVALEAFDTDPAVFALRPLVHAQDMEIGLIAQMLLRELGDEPMDGHFYAESLANVLAVHLVSKYSNLSKKLMLPRGGLPKHLLIRTVDYLEAHLDEGASLEQLGDMTGYSIWHFSRLFKRSTGLSPHQYLIELRLERAKHLLASTEANIADVAQQVGLADQSHLARLFRAHVGVTPAKYRHDFLPTT